MEKVKELYSGKAKTMHETDDPKFLIMEFRDDTSAFDGKKTEALANKGMVNNKFNAFIMEHLSQNDVPVAYDYMINDTESSVYNLKMFPIECVVRNISAGSVCRRLGVKAGLELVPPSFELFLKNDELGDPMINEYLAESFGWAQLEECVMMEELSFKVNTILKKLFDDAGMVLIDYKLEFGKGPNGSIYLGDEFTPDGCRIWDKETRDKLDKDRFREDMGDVVESYMIAGKRLGIQF